MEVVVEGLEQLRDLSRKLRHAGERGLARELTRAVRAGAKPAAEAAKSAARGIPAHGIRGTGLRQRLASGVKIQVRTGSAVRIVSTMPRGEEALARGMDNPAGWKHPVFGRMDVWVRQPGHPWFREPIAREADQAREKIVKSMDAVAKQITSQGVL